MDIHRLTDAIGARSIAVVIPSYNAGLSIASVVIGFQKALPGAEIIVFDNCSDDNTAHMARAAGARIVHEPRRGKTNVITRIFSDVDADLYVMASANGAHDPAQAPMLIAKLIDTGSDMAVGVRRDIETSGGAANRLFQGLFGPTFNDIFSGYRVFTRRFVKSFPTTAPGLDIMAEMSVHACELRIPTCETTVENGRRQEGSSCERQSGHDLLPTLWTFAKLFKDMRPAMFHAVIAAILAGAGLALAVPTIVEILQTGQIIGLATTIMATIIVSTGLMLAALFVGGCGMMLNGIRRLAMEQKRLTYLSCPGFGAAAKPTDIRFSGFCDDADDRARSETIHQREFPTSANAA